MYYPKNPKIRVINCFLLGALTIILGYVFSKELMQDDYLIGLGFVGFFGILFILCGLKIYQDYKRKVQMIEELSIFGEQIGAVIVNSRAISGGKDNPPQGYEYLCQGFEGDKIYGSDMIKEDRYTLGQRVTIYKDRSNEDRYWIDLDSVIEKNEKSGTILQEYNQDKGEGILNEIFHKFDDKKNGKMIMTIWLAIMGITIAAIPYILLVQFIFFMWNPDPLGLSYGHIVLFTVALIPYGYIIYKLYTKLSLAFGKAFFDGLQKVLTEIQKNSRN